MSHRPPMQKSSPKSRRASFDLPIIEEAEEETMRIILLRRLLPIGNQKPDEPFSGFFDQLKEKRKKEEHTISLERPPSPSPSPSPSPLTTAKPRQPLEPRSYQPSPRPCPPKMSADSLARLELKQLDMHFHSGSATAALKEIKQMTNAWVEFYSNRPRIMDVAPPFDGLAFARCLSTPNLFDITYMDDLNDLKQLIFKGKGKGNKKPVPLTQDEFLQVLEPFCVWESLFGQVISHRKNIMKRPISQLSMLIEFAHNNCQPIDLEQVKHITLQLAQVNGAFTDQEKGAPTKKTHFTRVEWIKYCYAKIGIGVDQNRNDTSTDQVELEQPPPSQQQKAQIPKANEKKKAMEKNNNIVSIQGRQYRSTTPPMMVPIGNEEMLNDVTTHVTAITNSDHTNHTNHKIVIIGSAYHKAMEFRPVIAGITPDIKGKFNEDDAQGKVVFATLNEICTSIAAATHLNIRKDPIAVKEKEAAGNEEALVKLNKEKKERLVSYKQKFQAWMMSLAPTAMETTTLTFIRNIFSKDTEENLIPKKVKPTWVTELGVEVAFDCGSGQVALVDGNTGAQLEGKITKWSTTSAWTNEECEKNAKLMLTMCTTKNPDDTETRTIAYGTGNWRKDHMRETIASFQRALFTKKIDFQLLPGSLEAKYGGISTLKLVAPYDRTNASWVIIETGRGSTQISIFQQVDSSSSTITDGVFATSAASAASAATVAHVANAGEKSPRDFSLATAATTASATATAFSDIWNDIWNAYASNGTMTALCWPVILKQLEINWLRDKYAFDDLDQCKTTVISSSVSSSSIRSNKIYFVRLMNIIQFFLQYNNEQDETVQDATRLNRDLIDNLIHAYYQNILSIYPNEQNNKYEHEKSELIEQLIHHVHASNQTISVHDFLLVAQHIHHVQ